MHFQLNSAIIYLTSLYYYYECWLCAEPQRCGSYWGYKYMRKIYCDMNDEHA